MKYYYELRYPQSYEDSQRNCIHINQNALLKDALARLDDYLIEDSEQSGSSNDVKLLQNYKEILQNDVANFDLIKFPVLKDVYNYDDQCLIRVDDKNKLDPERDRDF